MAFGFGNTVNPQLGATNYSGFLQGALSGAQMQAQGGAAIGQGIASLGKGIGSGIEKYQQNKIILAGQIGDIEAGIKQLSGINPNFLSSAPAEIQKNLGKLEKNGTLGVKEAAFTNAYLSTAIKSAANEQERTRAEQAARISGLYRQGDGRIPSMVNERSFDPVALEQGRGAYLRDALTESQIAQNQAQARGAGATGARQERQMRLEEGREAEQVRQFNTEYSRNQFNTEYSRNVEEAKRQKDIQNNEFLKQAIFLNTEADTGEVDFLSAATTAVDLGAAPDYVTKQLEGFQGLTPKAQVTPTITAVPNPVTGGNVGVLQTGPNSFSQVPGFPVKSPTETRMEAKALEDKRILDIQRTAIALDGDEQKKYLDSLPISDRGAARKAIRAYEGKGETAGLLEQILNPTGTSAPTGGSNSREFRSKF